MRRYDYKTSLCGMRAADTAYVSKRVLNKSEIEKVRQLDQQLKKEKRHEKRKRARKNPEKRDAEKFTLEEEERTEPGNEYRDRAAERRMGMHEEFELIALNSTPKPQQIKKSAIQTTLEKIKKSLLEAKQSCAIYREASQVHYQTRLGRLVHFYACPSKANTFQKPRSSYKNMYYTYNLRSKEYDNLPVIVQSSAKEDAPRIVSGEIDESVIGRVRMALFNHRIGAKKPQKEPTMLPETCMEEEIDIFPDAGEYIAPDQRHDTMENALLQKETSSSNAYFHNLGASIEAASEKEGNEEMEKEKHWDRTLKAVLSKSVQNQSKANDCEKKSANLYEECYPSYQTSSAFDSDDEESKGNRKKKDRKQRPEISSSTQK